jgi:hypothetical protein
MRTTKRRAQASFEDRKTLKWGGRLLIVSDQAEHFAHRTMPSERGDIANCLRTNGGLNATDNTICEHAKENDSD